jgi:peptidoglycan hydrolase CwlO-like protein
MSGVFETANNSLAGIFESLQREITRIDGLDAATRSKQQRVDDLTAQETELKARVSAATATLADLERRIADKVDEHDRAKRDFEAWVTAGRAQLSRLPSSR